MSYKDILVFLDGSLDNDARLSFALSLAQAHGARLTGLDVSSQAAFEGEWSERAQSVEETFRTTARRIDANARFRVAGRGAADGKGSYAHYADLLIATQPYPEASSMVLQDVPEGVLISAGVPMIVLPHDWRPRYTVANVLVAWSPSSQATRAVHDAMPILTRAQKVTVFSFNPPSERKDADVELLCDHLLAHNVVTETERWSDTGELTAIEALFASRAMEEADIIVAGAYSHSRFREALFGGMTKTLLQQFSMPVLVSH